MLIAELDSSPFPVQLSRDDTYFHTMECSAAHDPGLPDSFRDLILDARTDDGALLELRDTLLSRNEIVENAMMATTQAVDLIVGGVKVNSIPTSARATVNHRIAGWR